MWRRLLLTDKSNFNVKEVDGSLSTHGTREDYKNPPKTFKYGGGSVMVWGCFLYALVGPLHKIERLMNAAI